MHVNDTVAIAFVIASAVVWVVMLLRARKVGGVMKLDGRARVEGAVTLPDKTTIAGNITNQ
jgi:hypothetical protein